MPKTDGEAGDITQLLIAHRQGEKDVLPRLVPMVYEDLKRLARLQMRGNRGATLDSGALAHEAYLRLVDQSRADWNDRRHFFAVAAMAMRQIVVDHARRRRRQKRGAGIRPATLVDAADPRQGDIEEILSIDGVLDRLEQIAPRQVRIVECRYFAGMTEQETAEALDLAVRTVQREWFKARAWLREALVDGTSAPSE
jgi:RNA polymerase sigma factor (TIGR02999 family)